MKIRAIRVAECGRFSHPVALEGLSGGLDLLIGPNEAGKSTLLRALRFVLFEKHRSNRSDLAELRPYRGGAPLVEVDFDIKGERWRVRKRFLAERMAEVVSLSTGAVARGADAEALLEQLLDLRASGGRFPLLWLSQGDALSAPKTGEASQAVLAAAIAREVAAVAGGTRLREVRARVQASLSEVVTSARGQPRGRYLSAMTAADTVARELTSAREAGAEVEALLDRLGRVDVAAGKLLGAAVAAERSRQLAEATGKLTKAREAVAARDRARLVAAETRSAAAATAAAERALAEGLAEQVRLDEIAAAEMAGEDEGRRELEAAEAGWAAARQSFDAARAAHSMVATELRSGEAAARYRRLADRAAPARVAAERISLLQAELSGLPLDDAPIREARRLSARQREILARIEATASTVTVAYRPGVAEAISISGRGIADGERLVAAGPLVLDIARVGTVTVEPGATLDGGRLQTELEALRAALQSILAIANATDVAMLEVQHEEARQRASELAEARAALAALAPDGLARLEAELAAAAPGAEPRPEVGMLDLDGLRAALERHARAAETAETELHAVASLRETLGRREAGRQSRLAEQSARRAEVAARLPPPEARARRKAEFEAAAEAARQVHDEALRTVSAWEAAAPDAKGMVGLETDLEAARQRIERAGQEAAALAAERARIEGALQVARREDIASRIIGLEASHERAQATLSDIVEEVSALRLLEAELGAEEARLQSSYLGPVTERLAPYLGLVFPDATVAFGASFQIDGVTRGEVCEQLPRLSEGTREQIAVLVRLGFARLLADQGMDAPLLLDDVLVYADDRRIAAMHRALELAATVHQVVVLTCREQAFAGLRGTRVELTPWRPQGG